MKKILVAGSGHIGSLIAILLNQVKDYQVIVIDKDFEHSKLNKFIDILPQVNVRTLDVSDKKILISVMKEYHIDAVISCLPFYLNEHIATCAKDVEAHYFDLTEDVQTTQKIKSLAEQAKTAFVPQCGIAPGFINLLTHHLMGAFDHCKDVKLRVGGLPKYIDNTLKYGLTWSLEGLINQYCNPCPAIEKGVLVMKEALDEIEELVFDGCSYEAFHTSGGVGHLVTHALGKVENLNYKTIRYPGHCEKMRFLIKDLNLNQDRKLLFQILQKSLPQVDDDVLLLYASVSGLIQNEFEEKHYFKKILPTEINGHKWTAMQTATASSVCSAVDLVLSHTGAIHGFISHAWFHFDEFVHNRFACCFI